MNSWRNPEQWSAWLRGDECPICHAVSGDVPLVALEASVVMMPEQAPMRGYLWMPLRRHVIELHELTPAEGAAFMRDMQRVSRAIAVVTGAVKLNHEIHGNTVPHLHLHVFPRYPGDPFEGGPIDPKLIVNPVYAPGEFAQLRDRFREEIGGDRE